MTRWLERGGMRNANCRDAPIAIYGEPNQRIGPLESRMTRKLPHPRLRRGADGKGRSRLPVTADADGLANPGIRRNLASRLPYEGQTRTRKSRLGACPRIRP